MKTYRVFGGDGVTEIGFFSQSDLRGAIEKMAGGRGWGWRPAAGDHGMEAVCDYSVIAVVFDV